MIRTNSTATQPDKDSVSEFSLASIGVNTTEYVNFSVHGICEPGKEIKEDLVKVLRNKLDYATLDQLNLMIARNPKCRLAATDVQVNVFLLQ